MLRAADQQAQTLKAPQGFFAAACFGETLLWSGSLCGTLELGRLFEPCSNEAKRRSRTAPLIHKLIDGLRAGRIHCTWSLAQLTVWSTFLAARILQTSFQKGRSFSKVLRIALRLFESFLQDVPVCLYLIQLPLLVLQFLFKTH